MHAIGFDTRAVRIGGAWRLADTAQTLPLFNPSDGSQLARIARGQAADIDAADMAAQAALDGAWGALTTVERGRVLLKMSALAMGNACVLKPAEEACLTALAFARMAVDAGLPAGALNVVPGLGEEAGAALAAHRGVHHISFTGSMAVGAVIQAAAAKNAVPVTLELGGKSPQIVFADADLDAALPSLVNAGIQNAGQTCSAASRLLVQRNIHDEALRRLVARDRGLTVAAQARLPESLPRGGYYVPPTLVASVAAGHRIAQEEIFGPVQALIAFDDEAHALSIANGTAYGLVAGVWTRDSSRALRMARKLRCGQVFVNNYGAGGGIELPFGGVKHSGHGREKGFEALYGFSTLKTVAIKHD